MKQISANKTKDSNIILLDVTTAATVKHMDVTLRNFITQALLHPTASAVRQHTVKYLNSPLAQYKSVTIDGLTYARYNTERFGYDSIFKFTPTDTTGYIRIRSLYTLAQIFNASEVKDRKELGRMLGKQRIQELTDGKILELRLRRIKSSWYFVNDDMVLSDYTKYRTDSATVTHIYLPKYKLPYPNETLTVYTLQASSAKGSVMYRQDEVWIEQCPTRAKYLQFSIKLDGIHHRMYIHKSTGNMVTFGGLTDSAKLKNKVKEMLDGNDMFDE